MLLSLASFAPARDRPRAWLRRRIAADYRALADAETFGPSAIDDLRADGRVLTGAAVVTPAPVRPDDAVTLFRLATPPGPRQEHWDVLAGHPDGPTAQALANPLVVALARTAYADAPGDPTELTDTGRFPTPAAVEHHLLDAFVPTLCTRAHRQDTARRRRDPARAPHHLTHLAAGLRRQGTYDLAWWQLHRWAPTTASPWRRVVLWMSVAALLDLLMGATCCVFSLGRGSFTAALDAASAGLVGGAVIGVCFAALRWIKNPSGLRDVVTPASSVRADRLLALAAGTVAIVAPVLTTDVPWTLIHYSDDGRFTGALDLGVTLPGVVYTLLDSSAVCLVVALNASAWAHHTSARLVPAARGRLPWRLQAFLAEAHRLGILRQVGATYQFRHARLQDHLAARHDHLAAPWAASTPPPPHAAGTHTSNQSG
ncbi:hypothetical protein AB0I91_24215 [Actinosynnema sp. NPDC049800]